MAWKTGTSNGFRDAWCVAFNRRYTVGVWLGNKSGRPAACLVGASAAAPVLSSVLTGVYRGREPDPTPSIDLETVRVRVCGETGLRITSFCPEGACAAAPRGVPVRCCRLHRHGGVPVPAGQGGLPTPSRTGGGSARVVSQDARGGTRHVTIASPSAGEYVATAGGLRLRFASSGAERGTWFLDGRCIAADEVEFWHEVGVGRHVVTCFCSHTGATDRVAVTVR